MSDKLITQQTDPEALDRTPSARSPAPPSSPASRSARPSSSAPTAASCRRSCRRACAPSRSRISADTSAGGFILPNDRVDVIMTRRIADAAEAAAASSPRPFSTTSACSRSTRPSTSERRAGRRRPDRDARAHAAAGRDPDRRPADERPPGPGSPQLRRRQRSPARPDADPPDRRHQAATTPSPIVRGRRRLAK